MESPRNKKNMHDFASLTFVNVEMNKILNLYLFLKETQSKL